MSKIIVSLLAICTATAWATQNEDAENENMSARKETIAVLGTGDMGDSFGPRLADGASADSYPNAARAADIVLVAVASRAVEQIIESLDDLDGKILIDLNWPPTRIAEDGYEESTIDTSVAERIQMMRPDALVVKAFGTMASNVIDNPHVAGGPVTAPIASDHRQAKETVARIAAELELDPVDAGPLRMARHLEALMMLYMVPHTQGRQEGWDFYFRRSNYWACNTYSGGELESGPPAVDADNLAQFPPTQGQPEPCP